MWSSWRNCRQARSFVSLPSLPRLDASPVLFVLFVRAARSRRVVPTVCIFISLCRHARALGMAGTPPRGGWRPGRGGKESGLSRSSHFSYFPSRINHGRRRKAERPWLRRWNRGRKPRGWGGGERQDAPARLPDASHGKARAIRFRKSTGDGRLRGSAADSSSSYIYIFFFS